MSSYNCVVWVPHFYHFLRHHWKPPICTRINYCNQCSKWKISRNGMLVKILEHSEEKFMFISYSQSKRNADTVAFDELERRSGAFRSISSPDCNSLLMGLPKTRLSVLNAAARMIACLPPYSHISLTIWSMSCTGSQSWSMLDARSCSWLLSPNKV